MLAAMAVGAGIGALGSLANTGLQFGLNQYSSKKAAKQAYEYWRQSQLDSFSLQKQSLEKAGYNPMLALSHGSSSFNQGVTAPQVQAGDLVGSARQGGELAKQAVKLSRAQINNIEADTELKEGQLGVFDLQKAKAEAEIAMLNSQTERSDLAYGRDIANTVIDIAGTGASLYSAKAMADVAKANAAVNARNASVNERRLDSHTTETHYDKQGKKTGRTERMTFSHGEPLERHSANPKSKPNATGKLGGSVKAAFKVAKEVGKLLLPTLPAAYAAEVFADDYKGKKYIPKHHELMYKHRPYSWSPLR